VQPSFGLIVNFLRHFDIAQRSAGNSLVLCLDACASSRENESGDLITIQQEIGRIAAIVTVPACSYAGPMNPEDPARFEL